MTKQYFIPIEVEVVNIISANQSICSTGPGQDPKNNDVPDNGQDPENNGSRVSIEFDETSRLMEFRPPSYGELMAMYIKSEKK